MAWMRTGTVSVTNGSKVVIGSGTAWSANVQAGDAFHGPDGKTYEIDFVSGDAALNLVDNYAGTTDSGQSYKVQPTQGRVRDLAAAVSTLITEYGSIENALTVLSGNVGIGTASPTTKLDVVGADGSGLQYRTGTRTVGIGSTAGEAAVYWGSSTALTFFSGVERMRIDTSGNAIPILTDAAPTLTQARQMVFTRVSDTQVRLSMRGADGNTRSTTLALA